MKKILLILIIFISLILTVSCNEEEKEPEHQHTPCPICGLCTDANCDGLTFELCKGHIDNPDQPNPDEIIQDLNINVEMHKIFNKYDPMTESHYDYLYLGYYPQRQVIDTKCLKALNEITEVNDRGYIEYDGKEFLKYTVVNNHFNADGTKNDDNFFKDTTGFKPNETYYFLVEPLAWKVIFENDLTGELVLQTENIIDARAFNDTDDKKVINGENIYANDYEYSAIRKFLNEDFVNLCFTPEEREMLKTVNNSNIAAIKGSNIRDDYAYNNTNDLVYLMSYQEAASAKYGFVNNGNCHQSRYATATEFAHAKGLIKHVVTDLEGKTVVSSIWLTRTICEFNTFSVNYVGHDGRAIHEFRPSAPNVGTRPCCTIKLND